MFRSTLHGRVALGCGVVSTTSAGVAASELQRCCGEDANSMERTIDVHVRALRKKLAGREDVIETVRGVGYRFKDG